MDINTRHEMGSDESSSKGSLTPQKKGRGGLVFLVLLIIVVAVLIALDRMGTINLLPSKVEQEQKKVDEFIAQTGAWHAVFLTNGQVYFGQLSNPEGTYVELKDVYYLQVQQGTTATTPQPTGEGSQVIPAPQPEPPRLTLIKFGTELHRPKDWMKINRDQVLFWEELSSESAVVQAIKQYKETQATGGQ